MIVRAWLITGIALIGISWYLTVSISPPNYQGSARSAIDGYREAGLHQRGTYVREPVPVAPALIMVIADVRRRDLFDRTLKVT